MADTRIPQRYPLMNASLTGWEIESHIRSIPGVRLAQRNLPISIACGCVCPLSAYWHGCRVLVSIFTKGVQSVPVDFRFSVHILSLFAYFFACVISILLAMEFLSTNRLI